MYFLFFVINTVSTSAFPKNLFAEHFLPVHILQLYYAHLKIIIESR